MTNLSNKVLETIKHLKPKSKWRFLLQNYMIWIVGFLAIIVSSLSTAVIIYMLSNNDWDISNQIIPNKPLFILQTMPIFWIMALIFLISLAYINFRHTNTGYRYKLISIIVSCVVVSSIVGTAFFVLGFGHAIDRDFSERMPIYERFGSPRRMMWVDPIAGRLGGKVIRVDKNNFDLIDFNNKYWLVDSSSITDVMKKDDIIRIIGKQMEEDKFKANQILLFDRNGQFPGSQMPGFMHNSFFGR